MNFIIKSKQVLLNVLALNFEAAKTDMHFIKPMISEIAAPIVKLMPAGEYLLYVRDMPDYSIDYKYPGGHTYNRYETMIALPSWDCDQIEIRATIAHELHHLARWQYAGYGVSLGEAVLSEGLATLYEEKSTGKKPPWADAKIDKKILNELASEWDSKNYNHNEWFFHGPHGRWIGYSIGYRIAKQFYPDAFDLRESLKLKVGFGEINKKGLLK